MGVAMSEEVSKDLTENVDVNRFERGLDFAARKHRGHLRKGSTIPYIAHLLQVAGIVLEYGGDEDQAIAALLHDAIEDGKATTDEVRDAFGDAVTRIVLGCSDTVKADKEEWWSRKRAYIERIRHEDDEIRLVSAADKLHNARSILRDYRVLGDGIFERFKGKKAGTLWYYRALIDAFRAGWTETALVDELNRTVSELERLAYPDFMATPPR
ncbi:MAG: HD domain-containing protein [Chloroflexota bacterium]